MERSLVHGWDARAILLGILAFVVTQSLAAALLVVTLFLFGHSPQSNANYIASVMTFAVACASYFVSGLFVGWFASNRPTAHGALLGAICFLGGAAFSLALFSLFKNAEQLPEMTDWAVLVYLAQTVSSLALAALGGWLGGKRRRVRGP